MTITELARTSSGRHFKGTYSRNNGSFDATGDLGSLRGQWKDDAGAGTLFLSVAIIDVYRTDLRSHFETKTDKRGTFVFAGLPITGTFLIVVSGPGLKWTYVNGIRLPLSSVLQIKAEPGHGTRPTQDQVMAAIR